MHIELGGRQSGKTETIIRETLRILKKSPHNEVCIVGTLKDSCVDIDCRIQERFPYEINADEYNRITFVNQNSDYAIRITNFRKFHTVFFDEFCEMNRKLEPLENGFYIGTATNRGTFLRIARCNNRNYFRRKIICRISKKTV